MNTFEIAGGSVVGRDHRLAGRNNQDAFSWVRHEHALVAVVCDGCGSSTHSEVGAWIGARLIISMILGVVPRVHDDRASMENMLDRVRVDATAHLRVLANAMGGSLSQTVSEFFLFTAVGVIVLPDTTYLFALGDGVFVVNGQLVRIGPFENNEPPYLAYGGLVGSALAERHPDLVRFQLYSVLPTCDVASVLIGTDGIVDLIAAAERQLPGRNEPLGAISQFWEDDRFFRNPDMVRRRLALAGRDVTTHNWDNRQALLEPGLLPDDSTLVVLRRRAEER
ncbi:protein phosphatase 2C domain-containing protein [Candidatus Uhrbacteria bacterium]|nr:protein phosphatase 2C domain-containing protein [Candidatus Uhrbacteria bacterium]